jgi:hypothetical protein
MMIENIDTFERFGYYESCKMLKWLEPGKIIKIRKIE